MRDGKLLLSWITIGSITIGNLGYDIVGAVKEEKRIAYGLTPLKTIILKGLKSIDLLFGSGVSASMLF